MSDYGIKVSKPDKSVFSTELADITLSSEFPLAKIDPTQDNTFITVQFTFTSSPVTNTDVQWYSLPVPYNYQPQLWQIWWNVELGVENIVPIATGIYVASTSPSTFLLWSYYNETARTLDFYVRIADVGAPPNLVGLTGTYSHYMFVDDLTPT